LLFNESRSGKTIQQWGLLVLILALGLSALAIAQVITTGHGWIYWYIRTPHGPFGPYVSANDYCGLLEMLIPVAAGYVLSGSSRRVPAVLLWIAVGVALASVAMSGSRGGAVVTLIEVLLFAYIAIRHQSRRHWGLGLPVILGLILISAGAFAWVANGQRETDRALSVFQTNKSLQVKMGDRLWVAKDTLRMALHHPWLGVGVGGFETAFPPYMSHVSDIHWTHAHDDFAEGLSETGLPGAVLLVWGMVLFISLGYFHIRERLRADWGWIPVGALVGATGLLCHSLVDFNLRIPANAAWFVVCLAVATHPGTWPDRAPRRVREPSPETDEGFVN
jgi:O-antigen ligase